MYQNVKQEISLKIQASSLWRTKQFMGESWLHKSPPLSSITHRTSKRFRCLSEVERRTMDSSPNASAAAATAAEGKAEIGYGGDSAGTSNSSLGNYSRDAQTDGPGLCGEENFLEMRQFLK